MKSRLLLFLSAIVVLAGTETTVAQDYAIKLFRPSTVGLKFQVTAQGTEREEQIMVIGGDTNRTENAFEVELAAQSEVLAVDPKGHVMKAAFTLEKCLKISKEGKGELFPKGTVIIAADQDGKTLFSTKDGKPVPSAESKVLSVVISVHHAGADDDDVFGTTARQKVGSSWPVNGEAARRDMEKKTPGFPLGPVTGSTRLVSATKVDGMDCLNLSAELRMQAAPDRLPAGMKLIQNELTARLSGSFPVDSARPRLTEVMEMTMKMALSGKFGLQQADGMVWRNAYRKAELKFRYPAQ